MSFKSFRHQETAVWLNEQTWCCRRHIPAAKYPASADRCLLGCPGVVRPQPDVKLQRKRTAASLEKRATLTKAPKTNQGDWKTLIDAPVEVLWAARIMDLRKYARHTLGIVGASKMRGGKAVLIPLILEKRAA